MSTLQCHSRGDKRFSALFAKVEFNGVTQTIEAHYQLAKRFGNKIPKKIFEAKGKTATSCVIMRKRMPAECLNGFYKYLWVKYFVANPDLLAYARTFDEFHDMFGGKSINRQDHVIRACAKDGLKKVYESWDVHHFLHYLKPKGGE